MAIRKIKLSPLSQEVGNLTDEGLSSRRRSRNAIRDTKGNASLVLQTAESITSVVSRVGAVETGKENSIFRQTTAPAHLNGRFWLDTSVTPHVLNVSNGTAWVRATPTQASEVGAFSETAGSALAGRVTNAETSITQQANAIALKADQTTVNGINTRLNTAEQLITPTAITSTVRSSTEYTNDLGAKENTVFKQNTAPAHVNGRLWLDTSVTPNVLNRSNGTIWTRATPTQASEVGAFSSAQGTTLTNRVSTAESAITQTAEQFALTFTRNLHEMKNFFVYGSTVHVFGAEQGLNQGFPSISFGVPRLDFGATNTQPETQDWVQSGSGSYFFMPPSNISMYGFKKGVPYTFSALVETFESGGVPSTAVPLIPTFRVFYFNANLQPIQIAFKSWAGANVEEFNSLTFTIPNDALGWYIMFGASWDLSSNTNQQITSCWMRNLQLEEGSVATAFSNNASTISGAKYIFDGDNASFYRGGLRIFNNANTQVFGADSNGDLWTRYLRVSGSPDTNHSPVLGSVGSAGLYLTNTNTNYGLMFGINSAGNTWIQSQRSDGNTAVYAIDLNPAGGAVRINGSAVWHAGNFNPASYSLTSHTHEAIRFADTRNVNDTPSNKIRNSLSLDFKSNTSVGNPPVNASVSFSHILTVAGWGTDEGSGGWPTQLSVGEGIAFRRALNATTWSAWNSFWHTGNFNGSTLNTSGGWNRSQTPHGFIDFGPANEFHGHIHTDRGSFHFNKPILVGQNWVSLDNHTHANLLPLSGGTMTGMLIGQNSTGAMAVANQGTPSFEVRSDSVNAAYMTFHRSGNWAVRFGLDTDNQLKVGGWSMGAAHTIWHAGNFTTHSAGSGFAATSGPFNGSVARTWTIGGGTGITINADDVALTSINAGSGTVGALRYNGTTRSAGMMYGGSTLPTNTHWLLYDGQFFVQGIRWGAGGGASSSDKRMKKDIGSLNYGVDLILNLKPKQFRFKEEFDAPEEVVPSKINANPKTVNTASRDKLHYGLIAQDVEKLLHGLGIKNPAIIKEPHKDNKYYGLDYTQLIAPMIATIQHLEKRIRELEAKAS